MSKSERGQLVQSAADIYEQFFVPALFGQFSSVMCDAARLAPGERVVDIACGTGALTRVALDRVGPTGHAIGVDVNEAMLETARRAVPGVEWRLAPAEELPFDDGVLDAGLCQFGLMFFEDRTRALREMERVVRPGGRVVVAAWDAVERSPGYLAMRELLRDELGAAAARSLEQPFVLGDREVFRELVESADLEATVTPVAGTARFASLRDWMFTDIRGWTLADSISDEQFEHLVDVAGERLGEFVLPSGAVEFDAPALLASARV